MAYVLLGILLLGLLASIWIAVMSSKTWPVYQTVLIVFIFIAGLVYFYLGARTLATHKNFREQYNRHLAQAKQLESQILPLAGGVDPQGNGVEGEIPRLKHELSLAVSARGGGVFYNVKADSLQGGVLQVTLSPPGTLPPAPAAPPSGEPGVEGEVPEAPVEPEPEPAAPAEGAAPAGGPAAAFVHGLVANTVLFVFDQKSVADGGRYLGEFKVLEAAPDSPTVKLEPNLPLTESQTKHLEATVPGTLVLYTTMPPDNAWVFAQLDAAQREALLPAAVVEEYAQADRSLRDYHTFFHENYVQRGLLANSILQTTNNIQRMTVAVEEANKEAEFRETEKNHLAADLANFQREAKVIADYRQSLEQLRNQVLNQLKATFIENRNAVATLTRLQLEAAEEIDRRTNLAAQ